MTASRTPPVIPAPSSTATPSLADRFLLALWVFSYAALLQVFHLVQRFEGSRSAGKQPAGGM